jgi:organic radical activating enzyme
MNHSNLLYILTTARCPLNCSFCMTKHLHRNEDLVINENSLASLNNLSSQSKKVCISGEGDPLVASKSLLKIIEHGPENTNYELITSSFWNRTKTKSLLAEISRLCDINNSALSYRISIDKFHADEIGRDVLEMLISIFSEEKFEKINLQIRSITGQEKYVFDRLHNLLTSKHIKYKILVINEIEYELTADQITIKIQFKPTVSPGSFNYTDEWSVDKYVYFLENSRQTNFHIGLLNDSLTDPLFDITINPNGDVVLYGAELYILGNITKEVFSYELLKQRVFENKDLSYLISTRFIDLLRIWRLDLKKSDLIRKINNPFWLIRSIY